MRIFIFWDSITEWFYDLKKWGWVDRIKVFFMNEDFDV